MTGKRSGIQRAGVAPLIALAATLVAPTMGQAVQGPIDLAVKTSVNHPQQGVVVPNGSGKAPLNEMVKVICSYRFAIYGDIPGSSPVTSWSPPSWKGAVVVNGTMVKVENVQKPSLVATKLFVPTEHWLTVEGSFVGEVVVTQTGPNDVRCLADPDKKLPDSNRSNNVSQVAFQGVAGTRRATPATRGSPGLAGNRAQMANPGLRLIEAGTTRACKGHVEATVTLDPGQFTGLQAKPETSPKKMNLHLAGSAALGNYVHCEYKTVGKELTMVYTYTCQQATPDPKTAHTFQCAP